MKFLLTAFFCGTFSQIVFAGNSNIVGTYEGIIWSNSDKSGTTEGVVRQTLTDLNKTKTELSFMQHIILSIQ